MSTECSVSAHCSVRPARFTRGPHALCVSSPDEHRTFPGSVAACPGFYALRCCLPRFLRTALQFAHRIAPRNCNNPPIGGVMPQVRLIPGWASHFPRLRCCLPRLLHTALLPAQIFTHCVAVCTPHSPQKLQQPSHWWCDVAAAAEPAPRLSTSI